MYSTTSDNNLPLYTQELLDNQIAQARKVTRWAAKLANSSSIDLTKYEKNLQEKFSEGAIERGMKIFWSNVGASLPSLENSEDKVLEKQRYLNNLMVNYSNYKIPTHRFFQLTNDLIENGKMPSQKGFFSEIKLLIQKIFDKINPPKVEKLIKQAIKENAAYKKHRYATTLESSPAEERYFNAKLDLYYNLILLFKSLPHAETSLSNQPTTILTGGRQSEKIKQSSEGNNIFSLFYFKKSLVTEKGWSQNIYSAGLLFYKMREEVLKESSKLSQGEKDFFEHVGKMLTDLNSWDTRKEMTACNSLEELVNHIQVKNYKSATDEVLTENLQGCLKKAIEQIRQASSSIDLEACFIKAWQKGGQFSGQQKYNDVNTYGRQKGVTMSISPQNAERYISAAQLYSKGEFEAAEKAIQANNDFMRRDMKPNSNASTINYTQPCVVKGSTSKQNTR